MSLTIKEAVYNLGTRLGVDMTNAPASNIADTIDYISDHLENNDRGDHRGVIASSVDHFKADPDPSDDPDSDPKL